MKTMKQGIVFIYFEGNILNLFQRAFISASKLFLKKLWITRQWYISEFFSL